MDNQEEFEFQAHVRHGDEYSYHRAEYVDDQTPVLIHCRRHGTFQMTPDDHVLKGYRCPKCAEDQFDAIRTQNAFLKIRQRYFEAYRTFSPDTAHEFYEAQTIEELAEVIHSWHEHKAYALVEFFQIMVKENF